jgi:hypothetical protein
VQFGLKDVSELPTLKEFEELGRLEIAEEESAQLPLIELEEIDTEVTEAPIEPADGEEPPPGNA